MMRFRENRRGRCEKPLFMERRSAAQLFEMLVEGAVIALMVALLIPAFARRKHR